MPKNLKILIVEDDDLDLRLLERAFSAEYSEAERLSYNNAHDALDHLLSCSHSFPDIILLDLNMPGMSGEELLVILKTNKSLKTIPIIVLSTTDSPTEIHKCYMLNANAFITKPQSLSDYHRVVRSIREFWSRSATLQATEPVIY